MKPYKIYLNNEDKTDSVRGFELVGSKYHILFNNSEKIYIYGKNKVRIIESALKDTKSQKCLEYLKYLAEKVGSIEESSGSCNNHLFKKYSTLKFVSLDSVLSSFLSGKYSESMRSNIQSTDVIFPFGFNESQKAAVDKALNSKISVIEGPPGTGKTQTILNIIANAVMNGESVAVVSGNNSATRNVFDKLRKYKLNFIAAPLGSKNNKEEFISTQRPLPIMTEWFVEAVEEFKLKGALREKCSLLRTKNIQKNELAHLKGELAELETEGKHYSHHFGDTEVIDKRFEARISNSEIALKTWVECEHYLDTEHKETTISPFKNFLEYFTKIGRRRRLIRKLLKQHSSGYLIEIFQKLFYRHRIAEVNSRIKDLTDDLEAFSFSDKMEEYTDLSLTLFKAMLARKYNSPKRTEYTFDDLKNKSNLFLEDYPVILSTTHSLSTCLSNNIMYDYVIIDESSQVDLCSGALALSCARKTVIVGDTKQLPHVVPPKKAKYAEALFADYDLPEAYHYKNNSLLSAMIKLFPNISKTLLREHYRCHPQIIGFCNKKFYRGQLIVLTDHTVGSEPLKVYKMVKGNHARGNVNQRQIDSIKQEIIIDNKLSTTDGSLGVVTPYRNQTKKLKEEFEGEEVKTDTVDKFQGQEKKVVILSTVDNDISNFVDNENRLNVAVSRAIEQLIVVVNDTDLEDSNIGDLVRYIEYNNFEVVESKVYSIFDYLYKCYAEERKELLSKYTQISEYDSENLIYGLIMNIFEEKNLTNYEVATHFPLNRLIRDVSILTKDELNYALNSWTHVDFIIYNSVDKVPVLIVEVDGVTYHSEGTVQAKRDTMKDIILNKYNLKIIRCRTDGSGEKELISSALD